MAFVNFYYELDVYNLSRKLASDVYRISKLFPAEERYSLTDQIRRSSRSIGAQIAESWAKRRYENHFISKLTDADAEQYEIEHDGFVTQWNDYQPCEIPCGLKEKIVNT